MSSGGIIKMNKKNKVTDVFEVVDRLPELTWKYYFLPPILYSFGLFPFLMNGVVNKYLLVMGILVLILCPLLLWILSFEADKEFKHIKLAAAFSTEAMVVMIISTNLLLAFLFNRYYINIIATLIIFSLRIYRINRLEKKIENGTYGYNLDGKINTSIILLASFIGARMGMAARVSDNPAIRSAYYLLIISILLDVIMALFSVDSVVALRLKIREKNKEVKKCQN